MECPKCGYLMDDTTTECPRCARAAQAPLLLPPAVPQVTSYTAAPGSAGMGNSGTAALPRTCGFATGALVCGLAGLCTGGVSALVGLVLGIIALVQINHNPRQLKGRGLAISGIVVSLLMVAGAIALSIFIQKAMHTMMSSHDGKVGMTAAMQQQITQGILRFHTDTGVYPDTLTELGVASESQLTTKVPPHTYHGPYVHAVGAFGIADPIDGTNIPANPLVDKHDTVIAHHWVYDKKTGTVHSPVSTNEIPDLSTPRRPKAFPP